MNRRQKIQQCKSTFPVRFMEGKRKTWKWSLQTVYLGLIQSKHLTKHLTTSPLCLSPSPQCCTVQGSDGGSGNPIKACVSETEWDRLFITVPRAAVYIQTHTNKHILYPKPGPTSWLNTINPPSHHAWQQHQRWGSLTWWHDVWHHSHNTHTLN